MAGLPPGFVKDAPTQNGLPPGFVKDKRITKTESFGRGALYSLAQQPRDAIAAMYASAMSPDLTFQDAMGEAADLSLAGRGEQAKQQNPLSFGGGQAIGNIAATLAPATAVTRGIGAAAPALSKIPVAGKAISGLAKSIGTSKGLLGVPAAGAIQGATSTAITEGDLSGALPGAVGAGVVGSVGKVLKPIADESISAARKGFVATLKKAGITDLTPGQLTGNTALETIDAVLSKLPLTAGAARKKAESQLRKFTGEALKFAGAKGDEVTPEVKRVVEDTFSQRYKDLMSGQVVNIDQPVLDKVAEIASDQLEALPTTVKPIVQKYMRDIVQSGGKLTGEAYQKARSAMTQQSRSLSATDTYTAGVLKDLRNALDDAAERSLPADKQGAWKELRKQYANYKSIQKASTSVSRDSLEGILSPAALLRAVETANKTKGQAGYGELYDIARAGRGVLADTVPDSGTAQRLFYQNLMTGGVGGLGVGGATYGATQDPETAALAAVLALGGPKAVQAFLNSKAGQVYFTKGIPGGSAASSPLAKSLGALGAASLANAE
jgi:hypothetical protein